MRKDPRKKKRDNAPIHEAAARMLAPICNYPYIECDKETPSRYHIMSGTFGLGISATLKNDPSLGIEVYKNCKMDWRTDINTKKPNCEKSDLIDPETIPEIKVFVKTIQKLQVQRQEDKHSHYNLIDAFAKESRRARAMGRTGLGTDTYDIILKETGELLDTGFDYYIMQFVIGESMTINLKKLHLSMRQDLEHAVAEIASLENTEEDTQRIKEIVSLLRDNLYLKIHWSIQWLDSIFYLTGRMFAMNLRHCDLHFENFRMGSSFFSSTEKLREEVRKGRAIPIDFKNPDDPYFDYEGSAIGYELNPRNLKLIDCAYALDVRDIIERSGGPHLAPSPCRYYRPLRDSDLGHLHDSWARIGIKLINTAVSIDILKTAINDYAVKEDNPNFQPLVNLVSEIQQWAENINPQVRKAAPEFERCYMNNEWFWKSSNNGLMAHSNRLGNRMLSKFPCTVQNEWEGMQKGRELLARIQEEIEAQVPNNLLDRKTRTFYGSPVNRFPHTNYPRKIV
eukprot:GHVP01021433.1.p1 GENE.GHVP01021433.1~~GHVP01021433.1.p1  ORF type:complete len:509 (+),score=84.14 GHVP01021433.1:436-1962(+)